MNTSPRKHGNRIALAMLVFLLVATIAFCLTACSFFNNTLKKIISGEDVAPAKSSETTDKGSTDSTKDDSTKVDEPTTDIVEHGGGDDTKQTEEKEEAKPAGTSGSVTINSALVFDKAGETDLTIKATHEGMDYEKLMGAGLVNSGANANVQSLTVKKGSSEIKVDGNYLMTLATGEYDFYYCVSDEDSTMLYAPFKLTVKDSKAYPESVKINYDIACPDVYVTFHCACGGKHLLSFDNGTPTTLGEGVESAQIKGTVSKSESHSVRVTCVSSERYTQYTKAAPDSAALTGDYLTNTYSFMGHTADCYIEDDGEAIDLFTYLAYQGEKCEKAAYVSSTIYSEITKDADAYLAKVEQAIDLPWSLAFSLRYSDSSKVVTFIVAETQGSNPIVSSGYVDEHTFDPTLSHVIEKNARKKSSDLPIDNKASVSVRNTKELLLAVESGYRPVATGDTLALYNKARAICYTFITNNMSDIEKLHVFYDYLAGEISYDYSTLEIYRLYNSLSGTLNDMQKTIETAVAGTDTKLTAPMKAALTKIKNEASSETDLQVKMYAYIQSLSAFSVEGVFNDKLAVCEGISYAFMLLCRIEGIECVQITGVAQDENGTRVNHAWNKVRLDGVWYCVDATWGSSFIQDKKYVTHRYFMVDEASFSSSHIEQYGANYAVKDLAIGNVNYYQSVTTAKGGHTLNVCNSGDLLAAIDYLHAQGDYYELRIDPSYDIDLDEVSAKIKERVGKGGVMLRKTEPIFIGVYA